MHITIKAIFLFAASALISPFPASAGNYSYFFPFFEESEEMATGIALRNLMENVNAYVLIKAYNQEGAPISLEPGAPTKIPARGQRTFLVDPISNENRGWLRVDSNQPLAGFGAVFANGIMMNISMVSELHTQLFIPHGPQNGQWDSRIYISSPQRTSNRVTVKYIDIDGNFLNSQKYEIPANGGCIIRLGDLVSEDRSGGSVEIISEKGVAAFARMDNFKTLAGMSLAGAGASGPPVLDAPEEERIFITDQNGKMWDITHAKNYYGMKSFNFFFGLGLGAIASEDFPTVVDKKSSAFPEKTEDIEVFGVDFYGEQRAYPVMDMKRREVFNDVFPAEGGDLYVAVTF